MDKNLKPELANLLNEIEAATEKFLQPEISAKVNKIIKKIRNTGAIRENFLFLINILGPEGSITVTHQNILDAINLSELQKEVARIETFKFFAEKFESFACKESYGL